MMTLTLWVVVCLSLGLAGVGELSLVEGPSMCEG